IPPRRRPSDTQDRRPEPSTVPPALAHQPAHRHSPRVARALLLGACALGLSGLAVTATSSPAAASKSGLASASAPLSLDLEQLAPHTIPVPVAAAPRASRSRVAAAKPAVASKKLQRADVWVLPSGASIVSPFGMRWGRPHKGVDFGAHYGAPIYAIGDGVVVGTGYQGGESGYGQITIISHGNGYYSAYAHQSSYLVQVGQHVSAGELIGRVGATGHVTGPHLHFEIRTEEHGGQINPVPWLRAHGVDV
ncbi:MAG: peptidase, partial [Frankiales bacterium]|nr:peptidase [Frankiales bacterium]